MKINLKNKLMATAIIVAMFAGKAQAQKFKTTESIRSQIINGTVPGLKYGPAKAPAAARSIDPNRGKETIGMQLKNENGSGMKFVKGSGAIAKRPVAVNDNNAAKTLPSAQPAKAVTEKKAPVIVIVPTQEESKTPEAIKN